MTLTPKGYLLRLVDKQIHEMMEVFGAICVEGPKWSGKTWASMNVSESKFSLGDSENNFQNLRLANTDLKSVFVGKEPHLIDEWQLVPAIWDATRSEVDKVSVKGRFILTGSSTPVYKGVLHSGAGRIGTVRMRTMSLFESGDSEGKVSLRSLFEGNQKTVMSEREPTLERLIELTVRGGWPSTIGMDVDRASMFVRSYLDTTIVEASHFEGKLRDREKIAMLVRSLARNESTYASVASLTKDISTNEDVTISTNTLNEYRDILSRMFLIEDQLPFSVNHRSSVRVGKTSKRHFTDPAISVAALGMGVKSLYNDLQTYGFMFESMCERDLSIYAASYNGVLRQYRDSSNFEVDAIIELYDGRWAAFEIKLGANQIDSAAENLLKLKDKFQEGKGPTFLCVLCGMSSYAYCREDGVWVVPPTLLRD